MNRPEILEIDAIPFPEGFDFNRYLQSSFRMFGTESTPVELICSNDVMDAILDKFGRNVMTYDCDGEKFCAMVDVAVSNVFFSWVFGFSGKVRINSPENVKEDYKKLILASTELN